MATTMQAWRLHEYGGPSVLRLDSDVAIPVPSPTQDVAIPVPSPTQVLIAVSVVGVQPFDWKIREGYVKEMYPLPLPVTIGVDFSGTVVVIGQQVSRFKVGDRVMTLSRSLGAFAEYIAVEESTLAHVPADISDVAAATLPIPVCTAMQTLEAVEIKPGARVLIHGASGVVGAFAIQFAKAKGAFVIAVASAKNHDYVLGLGADEFIDYQNEKFEEKAKNIDLVLDYVLFGGVDNTTNRSYGVLKKGGAFVTAADPSARNNVPEGFRGIFPIIDNDPALLERVASQIASGAVKSKVREVLPRKRLGEALEIQKAGGGTGRILVNFKQAS